jgi:hypothetical protein
MKRSEHFASFAARVLPDKDGMSVAEISQFCISLAGVKR